MNTEDRNNRSAVYTVALLLEFYEKSMLSGFYRVCEEYDCNIAQAFLFLKKMTLETLAAERRFPDFMDLVLMYARCQGLSQSAVRESFLARKKQK